MTDKVNFKQIKKLFSMKNDTPEEAKARLKRTLLCLPFSITGSLIFIIGQKVYINSIVEGILFAIYAVCILTEFISISSILGPVRVGLDFMKWVKNRFPVIFLNPLIMLIAILLVIAFGLYFAVIALAVPVIPNLCGLYKAKKNLDKMQEDPEWISA